MMPATGGQYVYLREAYGPVCAFVCGWVFVLAVTPGGIAFLAVGFSIYLSHFIPLDPTMRTAASLALIAVLSAVNYFGVRESAWVQRVFTTAKIAGLALVISAAFLAPHAAHTDSAAPADFTYAGIGFAMTACLMAYNGWSFVSFVAGEVTQPERNLPRALVIGMAVVMVLYIGANLAYMNVLTVPEIAATERVGAVVAERTLGYRGSLGPLRHRAAFHHWRDQRQYSYGASYTFCTGSRRTVLPPFRHHSSSIQDSFVRHSGARFVDRRADFNRFLRNAFFVCHSFGLAVLYLGRSCGVGAAAPTAGCPETL